MDILYILPGNLPLLAQELGIMTNFFTEKNTTQQDVDNDALPIEYIKGNDTEFVIFVQSLRGKAELTNIGGKARWVITRDDGTKYIARPQSSKEK